MNFTLLNTRIRTKSNLTRIEFKNSLYQTPRFGTPDLSIRGTVDSIEALFDGIACNDGSKVNQFDNKTSYIRSSIETRMDKMTIEFWFKLN